MLRYIAMERASASFEVRDHCEIAGRGVVLLGEITTGTSRAGMVLSTSRPCSSSITIRAIEFADLADRSVLVGLLFDGRPSMEFIRASSPIGCVATANTKTGKLDAISPTT
jgi:hypothetical protein